jgi:hypothetical protein
VRPPSGAAAGVVGMAVREKKPPDPGGPKAGRLDLGEHLLDAATRSRVNDGEAFAGVEQIDLRIEAVRFGPAHLGAADDKHVVRQPHTPDATGGLA